ncbi:hypothetical protein [Paraburkholderia caribensis]|uniref:hypothetical protein n=1 Tax=Paraburkholderia caribensis TaxID=75105 RepID=UPI0031DE9FD4
MSEPQADECNSQQNSNETSGRPRDGQPDRPEPEVGNVGGRCNASNESSSTAGAKCQPEDADGDYESKWKYIDQYVLIRRTADYCVAITKKIRLDWGTTDAFEAAEKAASDEARKSHAGLLADVAFAEASLCDELSETVKIHYKTLLGEAIVLTFLGQYEAATRMLEGARTYIQARNEETSRRWYLASTASATLLAMVAALLMWVFRVQVTHVLDSTPFWLILFGLCGSIGAMLSVIQRSGKLDLDACAGEILHWFEGVSRIAAGSICALIVTLAFRADIVFGAFAKGEHMNMLCLLAAIAAGTSERYAGSIISKFDETANRGGESADS